MICWPSGVLLILVPLGFMGRTLQWPPGRTNQPLGLGSASLRPRNSLIVCLVNFLASRNRLGKWLANSWALLLPEQTDPNQTCCKTFNFRMNQDEQLRCWHVSRTMPRPSSAWPTSKPGPWSAWACRSRRWSGGWSTPFWGSPWSRSWPSSALDPAEKQRFEHRKWVN